MAFYINSTNFYPGLIPQPTTASAGAPLFAATTTSGFWAYPGNTVGVVNNSSLQYRSIFTHGFTSGGYKDSNPWRTVHKTWHANDITISCGEQLDVACAYAGGTFSDYNGYHHGSSNTFVAASTHTSSYNLTTGANRVVNTGIAGAAPGGAFGYEGNNPYGDGSGIAYGTSGAIAGVGSWEMSVGRSYFAAAVNQLGQVGYISGGSQSTACDKFHFPTEIMYTTNAPSVTATSHATAAHGATYNWWSLAGSLRSLLFSSDTWATWSPGTTIAPDGVCKFLSTKLGFHYGGTGANVTSGIATWSDSTGTYVNNSLVKPQALGEENYQMGQNWGYCLGQYNGVQCNYTFKMNYSTNVTTVLGTASQPKGHAGMSSGACSSVAASVAQSGVY
jgi:hypothetical protein